MARYRKIDPRIWNDQKFNGLSDDGKFAFIFLLTHPHLTSIGAMRATLQGLAGELGWSLDRLEKAFKESCLKKMAGYDPQSYFIWLPNFLKYNPPESPNVVRSWAQSLNYLPECKLKNKLIIQVQRHLESLSSGFREAFSEAFPEAFAKAMPNQKQKQKQKKEIISGLPHVISLPDAISLKEDTLTSQALEILQFLNEKTERVYRPVEANIKLILARLKSGATLRHCFQVIAKKTREWKNDPKMAVYLRPATLFNATKFEQYVGELAVSSNAESSR